MTTTPVRRKLPDERRAITHKFEVAGHEGYITVGLYEDGMPGEIFLVMAKEGSTISGFADAFAQAVSYCLQYGVPLEVLVEKFKGMRFEPAGMSKNPQVRMVKSIVDYVFRWMALKFPMPPEVSTEPPHPEDPFMVVPAPDAPPCTQCGAIMARSGNCWKCSNCGSTSGC